MPVALLEEPFSLERLARDPVKHVGVDLRSNRLHEIARQAVAGWRIKVNETETGVESQRSSCEPGFGFENCIQIIQDCVDGIGGEPLRSR